ncbi:MAG: TatD family hydrolase [Phycisphaerales bacterium]|jgi:TatD DNase family protein|nr:TatD family hydrolase [Phycisphaerales bacterium]
MIDTHCHLTSKQLRSKQKEIIENAEDAGVRYLITVATDAEDSLEARDLAEADPRVFCSAGIHPLYADCDWNWDLVLEASKSSRCVAWGELGLDLHYDNPPLKVQQKLLEEHLALIEDRKGDMRPIIVHCRRAVDALLPRFAASSIHPERFVFHCFTETVDDARQIIDFGAMISFTGVVTFPNATEVAAAARYVPADRIMVETDAPYLTPEPVRKIRPNEPQYVRHTADYIANVRGIDVVDFEKLLDHNATQFFNLEKR